MQISSHVKVRSADSNPHRKRWPNINEAEDGMSHFFYKEPRVTHTGDFDGRILKAFRELDEELQCCLLCFFKFPPEATIKRTTMIYLWISLGLGYNWEGHWIDRWNVFLDNLVEEGFIQPIYQTCSLVPDSCRMSLSVRSALYGAAKATGFTSKDNLDLDLQNDRGHGWGHKCLINVGAAIINWETEIFDNIENIKCLYLGRWQSSAMHHIELADAKILHGLKDLKSLTFLSLRGISMITELPTSILELRNLEILDLQACHNLEAIPEDIGLLKRLTHLDMSECYFLEHMPESLAELSNLEVLMGFLIGDFKNKQSCTLSDLSRQWNLRKLNIYISVKDFHRMWDLYVLKEFKGLQKLTISWGGCSLHGESHRQSQEEASMELLRRGPLTLPPRLQKLDLQCFPIERLTDCLRLEALKELNKLYIRGGQLCDLGQSQEQQGELWIEEIMLIMGLKWNVEILCLNYLSKLKIDWSELRRLFPKLIYLHQEECPKLTNSQCNERGVWMNMEAIDSNMQLQKYLKTSGMISSSSMSGSDLTLAQDDSKICPVDEKQLS
ncbi:hypothetical protein RHMOL_Rhmol03G0021800 [Rhododendron molle]|uniref:Uncharacterized protein n=1 Tax=Rhododendron molle TaxID=49168 RepID=A0ACC0P9F3_RHOML|nr:hypothetical protein RHMOL_Rhmol03G0021800 [Rhododendron molle]